MKAAWLNHLSPGEYYDKPRWERATMVCFARLNNAIEYWMFEDSKPPEPGVKASRSSMKKPKPKKQNLRRRM